MALVAALCTWAYHATFFDRSEEVAAGVLLDADGHLNAKAFEAALNARFPVGTSSEQLVEFIEQQRGRCYHSTGSYMCRIPYAGGICVVGMIDVEFPTPKIVRAINAKLGADGC